MKPLMKIICNEYYCSDENDKQYPDCRYFQNNTCNRKTLYDEIIKSLEFIKLQNHIERLENKLNNVQ